jgi:hypothetical protein
MDEKLLPKNLRRNIVVFEMTLDGYDDKEIGEAVGITSSYCCQIRTTLVKLMVEPRRLPKSINETRVSRREKVVEYKDIWRGRLNRLKEEFELVSE